MITWEFFAGSRSFSKVASKAGHQTFTTDINDFEGIDLVIDFMDLNIETLKQKEKPDFIWFSPPCKPFSIAGCRHHFSYDGVNYTPISETSKKGIQMIKKICKIIEEIQPQYYLIENPRGLLRKLDLLPFEDRKTTWYCQWGDERAKPTDLWTNLEIEEKMCKNGNKSCHHQPAPRGARTGTQGVKGNYLRSIVPEKLCEHIVEILEKSI